MGTLRETLTRTTVPTIYEEEMENKQDISMKELIPAPELSCCCCRTFMSTSRQLPCGDIICLNCLKQTVSNSGLANTASPSFICPAKSCGKMTLVPVEGVENFPPSGTAGALSAILADWSASLPVVVAEGRLICGDCSGNSTKVKRRKKGHQKPEVGHECETCGHFLCWECWESHGEKGKSTSTEGHAQSHTIRHCHEHNVCCRHGNIIEKYCYDCHIGLCYICDVKQHSHHRKGCHTEAISKRTLHSQDLLTNIQESKDSHDDLTQQANNLTKELTTNFEQAFSDVQETAKEARRFVDAWEKEQLTLLSIEKSRNIKLLSKVAKENQSRVDYLTSILTACQHLLNTAHREKMDLLSSMNQVLTTMASSELGPQLKDVTRQNVGVPRIRFERSCVTPSYGQVQFGYGIAEEKMTTSLLWSWQADVICTYGPTRQPGNTTFLNDGSLVLSGQLNRNVWIFHPGLKEPQIFCTDLYPICLDASLKGCLAVCDSDIKHGVRYYNTINRNLNKIWCPADTSRPACVAHLSDGSRVVLCSENREGYIYNGNYEKQASFGKNVFIDAYFMCIDSQDRIIVSDQEEHALFIFDRNGDLLVECGGYGDGEGYLNTPKGVCVDSFDNILVADEGNNRVSVFDFHGCWCCHLESDTVTSPFAVGYTAANPCQLAVASVRPGQPICVSVFEVSLQKGVNNPTGWDRLKPNVTALSVVRTLSNGDGHIV